MSRNGQVCIYTSISLDMLHRSLDYNVLLTLHQNSDQHSIDAILKSLSSRPNVHATLIISRKDGSIIRATGLGDSEGKAIANTASYGSAQANETNPNSQVTSPEASQTRDPASQDKEPISVTQRLAASIHEFVVVSSKLAGNIAHLGTRNINTGTESLSFANNDDREPKAQSAVPQRDEDVQLLRMRTKRHEIIIYPDPNYLCCVVQNTSSKDSRPQ